MTAWQYIRASLRQYRRVHLAVAAGVAVATAVITGALLVGDSMRGSLRDLALRGLGRVDAVVVAEHPFGAALAEDFHEQPGVSANYRDVLPLMIMSGAATLRDADGNVRRATGLNVYGVTPAFWSLGALAAPGAAADPFARGNEIALTSSVAQELGARVGDSVVLRIPITGATPGDSALGEKEETVGSRRLRVATVLDDSTAGSMARFALRPAQQAPPNVFVPLETLQALSELPGKANALVLATDAVESSRAAGVHEEVAQELRPSLDDYGLDVELVALGGDTASNYLRISGDRLVVPPHVVDVARQLYEEVGIQPVVTYLANTIMSAGVGDDPARRAAGERKIPYSTVVGVDSTRGLGPLLGASGEPIELADDEIALNDWAAEDLGVAVGDEITLRYYEPETTHGVLLEHEPLRLKLKAIVPLADADSRPTAAADPNFAPELPGVTDQESIESWELPFELVETVRDEDEEYWTDHRTTPKAFVSFDTAKRLWATRWGTVSVLRIPAGDNRTESAVAAALRDRLKPSEMGISLVPVKQHALQAASGTTPFDGLFLGFSFFLMASAVMLTALLFRLGIEQRAREVGLLLATGSTARRVRRLLSGEALIVAAAGAAIGAALGVAYAAVMVHGLNTWWVAATTAPFLKLHVTWRSLVIGIFAGLVVAMLAIRWSLGSLSRLSTRQLLAGDPQPPPAANPPSRLSKFALPLACFLASIALGVAAIRFEGEAQAGAFFGGGALALIGILAAVRGKLREATVEAPASLTLAGLAARNARRNPSRTMLSLALAATASFLIVALSAFRLAPTPRGTGGFDLLGTADLPLHYDLGAPAGRAQLGFSAEAEQALADSKVVSFRVRDGEDASCLNLYQTSQPRVLGAPRELAANSNFQWAMAADPSNLPAPSPSEGREHRARATRSRPSAGGTIREAIGEGGEAGTSSTTSPPTPLRQGEGSGSDNGWSVLNADLGRDANHQPIIPMVLDRNTAFYSLKLYKLGDQLTIRDALDRPITLQIVGMLANSILQGDVIVSEGNFVRLFPEVAGRRFFLIRQPPPPLKGGARGGITNAPLSPANADSDIASSKEETLSSNAEIESTDSKTSLTTDDLASLLETQLEDFGFDAVDARARLARLMAVQNTYLSTFQTLGGLGLLLGAVGLAVVQLRSVLERRGELALMQAAGFRRHRLARMVLAENLVLLFGGLGIGSAAALAAVLPHAAIEQVGAPWRTLAILLALIAIAGIAAGWWASRAALRAPLIPALRGE